MKQTEHHLKIYDWVASSIANKRPDTSCPLQTVRRVHPISYVDGRGAVHFEGSSDSAGQFYDTIILCTGYHYVCNFLDSQLQSSSSATLYKMIFPTHTTDGTLSFVGIPYRSEIQSQWVASILLGRLSLPTTEEMNTYVNTALKDERIQSSEHIGAAHAHKYTSQPDYVRDIIAELDKDTSRQYQYTFLEMCLSRYQRKVGDPTFAELYPNADQTSFADTVSKGRPQMAVKKPLTPCETDKHADDHIRCSHESKQEHKSPTRDTNSLSPVKFY